jgi:hypothetical protein
MKATHKVFGFFSLILLNSTINAQSPSCASATPLTVNTLCTTIPWTNGQDGIIPGGWSQPCGSGNDYQDVWYQIVGTGGEVGVNIFHLNSYDAVLAVYDGTCPTAANADVSSIACEYITGNTGGVNFPTTSGEVYYIQIQRRSGNTNDDQTGSICAYEYALSPCGNPLALLNDFCETPASLTKNPGGTFSATTDGTFTPDHKSTLDGYLGATGPFCGLIHNNSWYQFVATSATETFPIIYVSCSGDGVQGHVYRISHDLNGCCETFTPVSNCIFNIDQNLNGNPGSIETITATGLTVGDTYVLMIDGYLGARCDFTIAGWGAKNVLPIELSKFMVVPFDDYNGIYWETSSENNNHYFNLLRSFNGVDFEMIGSVQGAGTSTVLNTYSFDDYDLRYGKIYYKLQQVDFDGETSNSKIISLDRKSTENGLLNVYPNPTENTITMDIFVATNQGGDIRIVGLNGVIIYEDHIEDKGMHQVTFDMTSMSAGLYFVNYSDALGVSMKNVVKR